MSKIDVFGKSVDVHSKEHDTFRGVYSELSAIREFNMTYDELLVEASVVNSRSTPSVDIGHVSFCCFAYSYKYLLATLWDKTIGTDHITLIFERTGLVPVFINHMIGPDTFYGNSYTLKQVRVLDTCEEGVKIKIKGNMDVLHFEASIGEYFLGFYHTYKYKRS